MVGKRRGGIIFQKLIYNSLDQKPWELASDFIVEKEFTNL